MRLAIRFATRRMDSGDRNERVMQDSEISDRLAMLRVEHRDLDTAIDALGQAEFADQLQLARLKKRKLRLKDEILLLENQLIPDIIA